MRREEAIKYLIKPVSTSTEIGEEKQKEFEAYSMAIEALQFAEHYDLLIKEYQSLQEVVRCKDCCHRVHDEERGLYYCEMYYGQGDVSDENFCQWGERKES